jgi:hypothetical protein
MRRSEKETAQCQDKKSLAVFGPLGDRRGHFSQPDAPFGAGALSSDSQSGQKEQSAGWPLIAES